MNNKFDLIVIGGGHAGVEAAVAGRRMKLDVALITLDQEKLEECHVILLLGV